MVKENSRWWLWTQALHYHAAECDIFCLTSDSGWWARQSYDFAPQCESFSQRLLFLNIHFPRKTKISQAQQSPHHKTAILADMKNTATYYCGRYLDNSLNVVHNHRGFHWHTRHAHGKTPLPLKVVYLWKWRHKPNISPFCLLNEQYYFTLRLNLWRQLIHFICNFHNR